MRQGKGFRGVWLFASSNKSLSLLLLAGAASSLPSWLLTVWLFSKAALYSLSSLQDFWNSSVSHIVLHSWYLSEYSSRCSRSLPFHLTGSDWIGFNSSWCLLDLDPTKLSEGMAKGKYEDDFSPLQHGLAYTFKNLASQTEPIKINKYKEPKNKAITFSLQILKSVKIQSYRSWFR